MKIKDNFMLKEIAGSWLVVPMGERVSDFNGMVSLSDSGALLWGQLLAGKLFDELVEEILDNYEIDEDTARRDVMRFLDDLAREGIIE